MKTANIIARFPLNMVREAVSLRSGIDERNMQKFGYTKAKKGITAAVICQMKDMPTTHCGKFPIIGHVGIKCSLRVGNICRNAYINSNNEFVYPA